MFTLLWTMLTFALTDRTNDTLTPLHEDPFFGPSRSSSFVFSRPDEFSRRSTPSIPPGLAPSSTGPSFASFQDAPAVPDEVQGRKVPAFYGLGVTPTKPSKSERQKAERRSPSPIKTESAQDVVPREPLGGPAAEQPPIQPAMSAIDTTSFPALPTPSVVVSASRQTKAEKAAERALARMQKDDRNKENVPMVKKSDIEKPSVVIKSEPEKVAEPVPQVQISEQAQHPAKVDLTKVNEELASSSATIEKHSPTSSAVAVSKPSTPSQPSRDMTGTPSTISRPATPSASIVETPVKRTTQPRTIRVLATTTPKTENPPLVPAITELKASTPISRPTPAGSKQPSRQGSVISLDIPGTPVSERISDTVSVVTDADSVSRADSPPTGVNRVGSAPVRSKTKSQVKKDRQERAKAEEKKSIESQVEATPVEAIVQEPIMGRKKKAKKAPAVAGTATSTPGPSRPPSPKPKAANVEPQAPVPNPEPPTDQPSIKPKPTPPTPTPEVAAVRPVTPPPRVDPVPTMKAVEPTPPSQMMSPVTPRSPPSFQASVLAGLEAAGELQPELLNFFKMLPTFDFKHDVTGADLSDISHTIPLTKAELAKLDAGEAVRRGGEGGRSFSRVMLTPSRKALRALSQEQEDRYLELEASVAATKPPYKYTHKSSTIDMQYLVDNILLEAGAQMLQPPKAAPVAATTQPNNNVEIQTVYGDDALRFLNQYILPTPVPSASASTVAPVHVSEARLANRMVSRRVPPAWPERTDAEQASVREANDRVIQMHAEHMEYLAEKARQIAENPDADVFGPNSTNAPSSADHRKIKQAFHKAVQGVVQVAAGIASSMGQVGGGHAQVDDRVQQSQAQAQAQPQLQDQRFDTAAYEAKRVVEIEREYQQKKKEVEKFEKQMAGLVKKNRKIMGMTGVGTVV
jgi:CCR4-NOT transcription complex subunit 4